jgi:hypothetical protein
MLSIYKKITLLLLFVFVTYFSQAQTINKFSSKKEEFIGQLEKFFQKTSEEESEKIMAELRAIWPMDLVTPKKEEKNLQASKYSFSGSIKKNRS